MKEIIYPLGATIDVRQIKLGDETMSVLEIWGAEYQENDCLLIKPEARPVLEAVCARERCILQVRNSLKIMRKTPAFHWLSQFPCSPNPKMFATHSL